MYYNPFPTINEQALRNVRRTILAVDEPTTARSISTASLGAVLHETPMEALRNAYVGFDYTPSHSFVTLFSKPNASATTNSTVAVSGSKTTETSAGAKRARSPTTTVDTVRDETAPMPTSSAANRKMEPSAVVEPPDYQGRSFLFPPVLDPTAAGKPMRVPKRMLCMTAGQQHGVQVLRWAMPHGHLVFAGDVGGTVKVWNPSSAATMRTPAATYNSHSLPITALCVEDEGRVLTTSSHDGFIRQWDTEAGKVTSSITYKSGVGCSEHVLHPENPQLVLAAFDTEIALFDLRAQSSADSKPQRLYQGHMGGVMNLTFLNSRGTLFVSSSSDKTIRTWDFRVPVQVRQLGDPSMHAAPHMLKHPTKDIILAQSADNKIRMFDFDEGGRLRVVRDKHFSGHTVSGTSCMLAMSRDGQFISSGDATGQVFVWEFDTQSTVRKFPAHTKQCSAHLWHPQEPSKMVTGGWDNMIKVWV